MNDNDKPEVDWSEFNVNGDVNSMFNLRDWLQKILEKNGCKITDSGLGFGKADLCFELDDNQYGVSIWPIMK